MGKRKPNAADRELADYVRGLPVGKHLIVVDEEKGQPILKPEGGRVLLDLNRVTIVPHGGTRSVRVTMEGEGK
jgi:hypothetical protein